MLKKRIIPCFDIKDGRTVKGINFVGLRDAGDPVELAKSYVNEGADELVFLDIAATAENRSAQIEWVKKMAAEINIPFTVGGGIKSVEDARSIIKAGADKISLNSAAVKNPKLIQEIAKRFGSQCTVVAIDIKRSDDDWFVFINGGTQKTDLKAEDWARKVEQLGAGEILLTVMNNDGTKAGFELEITERISNAVNIPIIASGGAGSMEHFEALFSETGISAGLAASVFHFGEIRISALKNYLKEQKISIRQ